VSNLDRLTFGVDVASADAERRTIEGVAVPYGEAANLGGTHYRFAPGSLRTASNRKRTPLLLGHDMNRPVGVLTALADTPAGVVATFSVDPGLEGDLALAQAASGSRGGLSIGATVDESTHADDGVVDVTAATMLECSLVAVPAFAGADVTRVVASVDDPNPTSPTPETDADDPQEETPMTDNPTPDTETKPTDEEVVEASAPILVKAAAPQIATASDYVRAMLQADRGDANAAAMLRAAITPTNTVDVPGALPPVYTQQVVGLVPALRTLANTVANRPMPASGLKIIKPKAGTLPDGQDIAYDAVAPTGKITMTTQEVDVIEWAFACDFSVSIVERGTPDVVEYAYARIIEDYYTDVERALSSAILDNSGAAQTSVGAALAKVYETSHRPADVIVCAPDMFGKWIDAEGMMKWSGGSVSGDMVGNLAGVRVVVSPYITTGTAFAMNSSAIELRESSPIRLTATNVGGLRMELGVVSFYSVDCEDPNAIVPILASTAPKKAAA
jgi:HK97 family phage prohead protease